MQTATVPRWLGALCGVVLLAGVVAVAVEDDGSAVEAGDSASTTTSTLPGAPVDPALTVTTLPGDPGTTAVGGGEAPPTSGGGGDAPPVADDAALRPPVVGDYRYDLSGSDAPATTYLLHITADPAAPDDRLISNEGASLGLVERYRWAADGLYVIGGEFTALADAACEWQPAVLQLRSPLTAGANWEGASDCVATTSVGEIAVHAETRTSVVELFDTEVAGRTRRAARVTRDEDQIVTLSSNTVRSTAHYDDVVDVATGIVISSSASATTEGQPESTSERHLIEAPADW